jgi:hypothetical protein
MEDDWQYIQKRDYITECMHILENSTMKLGQVLVNRNYSEIEMNKRPIIGGVPYTTNDCAEVRYIVHEYYESGSKEHDEFNKRNNNGPNCAYWPHFSFRPSLLKTSMLKDVGAFPDDYMLDNLKDKVRAILITHAHLDHVGAVHYVASKYPNAQIYGTPFTIEILKALMDDSKVYIKNKYEMLDLISTEIRYLTADKIKELMS